MALQRIQAYLTIGETEMLDELKEEWRLDSISEIIRRSIYEAHKSLIKK